MNEVTMHPGLRHKIWYEFRDGKSVRALAREFKMAERDIEAIIRGHIKTGRPMQ